GRGFVVGLGPLRPICSNVKWPANALTVEWPSVPRRIFGCGSQPVHETRLIAAHGRIATAESRGEQDHSERDAIQRACTRTGPGLFRQSANSPRSATPVTPIFNKFSVQLIPYKQALRTGAK